MDRLHGRRLAAGRMLSKPYGASIQSPDGVSQSPCGGAAAALPLHPMELDLENEFADRA